MDAQGYPICHFEEMKRLALVLKTLPAQVLEHSYSYEAFGSWTITVRCKGHPLHLSFSGRENEYILERSSARKAPYSWSEIWRRSGTPPEDACSPAIVDAIRNAVIAGNSASQRT